jgi:hypothetical protein
VVNKWTKAMFFPMSADARSGLRRKQQKCLLSEVVLTPGQGCARRAGVPRAIGVNDE